MVRGIVLTFVVALAWGLLPNVAVASSCVGYYALTFDDGPHPTNTRRVLDALAELDAPSTFFVMGWRVNAYPDVVREADSFGHRIANITYTHPYLTGLSNSKIRSEVQRTSETILESGVQELPLVRPPFGDTNSRVKSVIESLGYTQTLWTVDPRDWTGRSASEIASHILQYTRDGSIIVLHDRGSTSINTVGAIRKAIPVLRSRGLCPGQLDASGAVIPPGSLVYNGSFFDDDDSIFEDAIEWLVVEGITSGCNPPRDNRFCPEDPVTRGQMAAFLVRALGYSDRGGENIFSDADGHLFERAIDRLAVAGVTKGCNPPANTKFCPDDFVTRGQMAALLVRALGYTDDGGGDLFIDDDGNTFEGAIDRLGAAKVTLGCNPPVNDKFCPDDNVSRGQMAAFLKRALG